MRWLPDVVVVVVAVAAVVSSSCRRTTNVVTHRLPHPWLPATGLESRSAESRASWERRDSLNDCCGSPEDFPETKQTFIFCLTYRDKTLCEETTL